MRDVLGDDVFAAEGNHEGFQAPLRSPKWIWGFSQISKQVSSTELECCQADVLQSF